MQQGAEGIQDYIKEGGAVQSLSVFKLEQLGFRGPWRTAFVHSPRCGGVMKVKFEILIWRYQVPEFLIMSNYLHLAQI